MPEALTLGLAPGRAVIGPLPGAAAGTRSLAVYPPGGAALRAPAAADVAVPVQTLFDWVRTQPVAHRRVNITLSNACVHHLLVPRNRAVSGYREREAYARAMVEEAFGLDGAAWHVAADDDPFAERFLAVAAPRGLLDGTQAALTGVRGKPGSIETFFVREWNAHRSRIEAACWLAVIEPGCAVIARVQGRRLAALRTVRQTVDTPEALLLAVEREALAGLVEAVPQSIYVTGAALCAPARLDIASATRSYVLHRLDAIAPPRFSALDRTPSRLLWTA